MKTVVMIVIAALAVICPATAGETWQLAGAQGDYTNLTDPSHWTNATGQAAAAFNLDDKYVVDGAGGSPVQIYTPKAGVAFTGGELHMGAEKKTATLNVYKENTFPLLNLQNAVLLCVSSETNPRGIYGNMRVSHYANVRWVYSGQKLTIGATLTGDSSATFDTDIRYVADGHRNEVVTLSGDCSGYAGTFKLTPYRSTASQTVAWPEFYAKLVLETPSGFTMPGIMTIMPDCVLEVATASASLGKLTLQENSRLILHRVPGGSGLTVTDTFTLGTHVTLEILADHSSAHDVTNTYPLLTVPHTTAVRWARFDIVGTDALPVPGAYTVITTNDLAGTETLSLVEPPFVKLVAGDVEAKNASAGQDNSSAFEKAASWSDSATPHGGADYVVEYIGGEYTYIRTTTNRTEQTFPGRSLSISKDCVFVTWATKLTMPALRFLDGSRLWTAQEVVYRTAAVDAPVEIPKGCTASLGPYNLGRLTMDGPITGSGTLLVEGVTTGTGNRLGYCRLSGDNSGFLGRIRIRQYYTQGNYGLDKNGQYLEFENANALGGALATFDDEALTVARLGYLTPLASVTLGAAANRGLYVTENGAVNVTNADTELTVNWSLKVDGTLQKLGLGTLALGGPLTTNGNCRLEVALGAVRARAADAMNGLAISFSPGGSLMFDLADMPAGGMRNLAATPFVLGEGMDKLPVVVKGDATQTLATKMSVPLVTVPANFAGALRTMWPETAPRPYRNCKAQWTFTEDSATQTFTVGLRLTPIGFTIKLK